VIFAIEPICFLLCPQRAIFVQTAERVKDEDRRLSRRKREPKRILSFGAGPHHCIGNILGRTTIIIAIRRLLARFPKAHLIDPGFTPVYGGAVGELRLQSLPLKTH
jgi:cytochrome P450